MITSFDGEYRFLSNFWMARVVVFGRVYASTEHAYQAMKAKTLEDHNKVANVDSPGQAKRMGKVIELRPDWETVKIPVMRKVVNAKFDQHPDLMERLIATSGHLLIEGNTWNDTFWGECPLGTGRNELGKILMAIRDDITRLL